MGDLRFRCTWVERSVECIDDRIDQRGERRLHVVVGGSFSSPKKLAPDKTLRTHLGEILDLLNAVLERMLDDFGRKVSAFSTRDTLARLAQRE